MVVILATMLVTALVLMAGFWLWLETYVVYSTVVPVSPSYRVVIPGKPAVSAKLYWLGNPLVGYNADLLVLTSKTAKHREFYWIDKSGHQMGLPDCPKYVPLLGSAIVDRVTLLKYPLGGELKAEWNANKTEVRIRIMGFSNASKAEGGPKPNDEEIAREMMPIAYQRELVFIRMPEE